MTDLPTQRDFDDFAAWTGRDVLAPDGDRLGAVELIFLDEATGVPEWVLVRPRRRGAAFVPLAGASVEERAIRVDQERERVEAAPRLEVERHAERRPSAAPLRALRARLLAARSLRPCCPRARARAEERPRLRKYVGSPGGRARRRGAGGDARRRGERRPTRAARRQPAGRGEPAAAATPAAAASPCGGDAGPGADRMAPRNIGSATASTSRPRPRA